MTRIHLLLVLLLATVAVPFAAGDTINLNLTNLPGIHNIGTVDLTQAGPGQVMVTIKANSGFSLKLNGGSVFFNTNVALTAGNIGPVTIIAGGQTFTGLSFGQFFTNKNRDGFGNFSIVLSNLMGPHGITSASQISFMISANGLTAKDLELLNSQGHSWGVHFCVGGGTNCGPNTGFAVGGSPVPEPGTLSLLGTGLVGLAGILRRRWVS